MKDFRITLSSLVLASLGFAALGGCSRQSEPARASASPDAKELAVASERNDATEIPARPAKVTSASIRLGVTVESDRMSLVNEAGDGATEAAEIDGVPCRLIQRQPGLPPVYMYFRLDPSLKFHPAEALVTVEYFDATSGSMSIDYDSFDELSNNPAYTRISTRVELKNDKRWHKAVFLLEKPRFQKGQHDGGDFRIALTGSHLFVRAVSIVQ